MTAHRSHPPMRLGPPPRPRRHSAFRYAALRRPIAAAALVGSLLVVTSTVAHTQTEETETDDTPTEQTGEQITDDAQDEVGGRGWGPYGCPERPPSLYHAEEPSWSDWCLDPDYWIVEVTCGPEHSHAGRTVRFSAEPERGAQPSLADICGAVECPPITAGAAAGGGAAPDGTRLAGTLVTTGPDGETFLPPAWTEPW